MILDTSKHIIEHYDDNWPVNGDVLLKHGFTFYQYQSAYGDEKETGWRYRDVDGNDVMLYLRNINGEFFYVGEIYFPKYSDCPRLRIPDPENRCEKCYVRNLGELRTFIKLVEAAAQLRMDIKKRSDEIKNELKAEGLLDYVVR